MKLKKVQNISDIVPYPPGKPLEELEREYGISGSIKLASNENPWGPSPKAVEAISASLANLHRYPDGSSFYLTQSLAERLGIDPEEIILGNGSNEVIEFLVKAFIQRDDEVISSFPSFLMYQKFVQIRGGKNIIVPLKDMTHDLEQISRAITDKTRLIFLDNPNNPCGTAIDPDQFARFIQNIPESLIVVLDEAYVDFMPEESRIDLLSYIRNPEGIPAVVGLRTFSKAYGLGGLRVGYGICHRDIGTLLQRVRQPFNISAPGQIGALAALKDDEHYQRTIDETQSGMKWLSNEVEKLGCKPYPSCTNFFLIDVRGDATKLYDAMLRKGVIVRSMKPYNFPNFIRITVGTEQENTRFIGALGTSLKEVGYV